VRTKRPLRSLEPARKIIVAIDGPSGAGKSTIAQHLARHFGLLNLETGAMYRAFALKALRAALPLDESAGLEALAGRTTIRLEPGAEGNRVLLDGEDVTAQLRNQTVTDAASRVSVLSPIRAWMVALQQQLGAAGGVVMEGRDIGTVVFPQAQVKNLSGCGSGGAWTAPLRPARPQAGRAAGRGDPRPARPRRARPQPRRLAPQAAADAILLDSTNLTLQETVQAAEAIVNAKLGQTSPRS